MLKFAHITDLHLTAGEPYVGYDTAAATRRALTHMRDVFPDIDFLVITGDLANWGEVGAYRRLKELLEEFPKPAFLMIGNHDNRANFLAEFGDRYDFALPYAQYAAEFGGHRLLFLDTQTVGTHGGALSPERLEWLEAQLAGSPLPVLMFMHHHPTAVGAPSFDAKGLANWPQFHAILSRYRHRIRHIFHGHCHALLQGNVEGISFTGIRSMGPQAYTDLKTDFACRWFVEPTYAIALVTDNSIVTHIQDFNYPGPVTVNERQKFDHFIKLCADRGVTVPLAEPAQMEDIS
ncbi:MAG TPA: phosphodiesterase [Devosiaceae bacterium]|jgi:3',5'-cyclic AMP phosphodiesterase CpdA